MSTYLEHGFSKNHALSLFYQWISFTENKKVLTVKSREPFFFSNADLIDKLTQFDKGCFPESSLSGNDFLGSAVKMVVIGDPDAVVHMDQVTITALAKMEIHNGWYLASIQMILPKSDLFESAILEKINIKLLEINSTAPSKRHSAYNSSAALFYMWMACIESAARFINPKSALFEKFRQLHDKNYTLNFIGVDAVICDVMLNSFMCTLHEMMKCSHHQPLYFIVENSDNTVEELVFEFSLKWLGTSHDNRQMQAQTRHKWRLKKSSDSILDKILTISVSELEPFIFTDSGTTMLAE